METVNEVSGRKSTSRANLKVTNQEERFQNWKEYFKDLLGNLPEITDKPTKEIIDGQLDIKLGQFMEEELNTVLKKLKAEKLWALNKIPSEV